MILSLYLCNMILLVAFFLDIITQLITVWFFSSHLCVGFLFLGLYSAPSPPSPPALLLLSLNFTQVVSHNAYNSSHTTPLISQLTQLISHNSTHSRAAFVWHLVELLSCPLTELHPSSFTQLISQLTQLISQLTQLISHNSSHLTTHTTHLTQLNSLKSCFRVAFGGAAFV